jgi:hypothetical protein
MGDGSSTGNWEIAAWNWRVAFNSAAQSVHRATCCSNS